jgi:hypothetical protein
MQSGGQFHALNSRHFLENGRDENSEVPKCQREQIRTRRSRISS